MQSQFFPNWQYGTIISVLPLTVVRPQPILLEKPNDKSASHTLHKVDQSQLHGGERTLSQTHELGVFDGNHKLALNVIASRSQSYHMTCLVSSGIERCLRQHRGRIHLPCLKDSLVKGFTYNRNGN